MSSLSENTDHSQDCASVIVRDLGLVNYHEAYIAMRRFTDLRKKNTFDEFWVLEHASVYTQGVSCNQQPFISTDIPVVKTDRGGQMTYHGPGQLIIYLMLDLKRRRQGIRQLVATMESAIISTLSNFGIHGETLLGAPGVYVNGLKIASLGLRVRRSCTYHGLSLNVSADITPFRYIEICGVKDLKVTTMANLQPNCRLDDVKSRCVTELLEALGDYKERIDSFLKPHAWN